MNKQMPQTPPLQVDANTDSKLTGAYRSGRSLSPSDSGKQGNNVGSGPRLKDMADGEQESPAAERTDESRDSDRHQKGQSEV